MIQRYNVVQKYVGGTAEWEFEADDNGQAVFADGALELERTVAELREALREWSDFCARAKGPINAAIQMSDLHGFPYTGPNWAALLKRTDALLTEHASGSGKETK